MQTTVPTAVPPVAPKPRKRRRWYIVGGFLLALFGTPVVYYFVAGWLAERRLQELYAEMDAEDPNWRWADLVAELKPAPDDENSAVQIMKAHGLLKKTPFALNPAWITRVPGVLDFPNAKLMAEDAQYLKKALATVDPEALAAARRLKDFPSGRFRLDPNEIAMPVDAFISGKPVPVHREWSEVVTLLEGDALWRAERGELEAAADSCHALLHAIHSFADWPVSIGQFLRAMQQAKAVIIVERILAHGEIGDARLQQLQSALEREIAADGRLIAVRGDRAMMHDNYLRLRDGRLTFAKIFESEREEATIVRILDLAQGTILSAYPEVLREVNEKVAAARQKGLERDRRADRGLGEQILSRTLFPGYFRYSPRAEASMRAAAVGIAAERFRLQHGFWPSGLDELVKAGFLKAIPTDPQDGQPLRWKKTPTGLVIYGLGVNKTDHGGKLDRSENSWRAGVDFGVELWDRQRRGGPAPAVDEKK